MMRRPNLVLCGAITMSALVAGCSHSGGSTSPSSAPATVTSGTSISAALPHSGAPKVEQPLPASVLSGDPCAEALTSQQLTAILGVASPGKATSDSVGTACDWSNSDKGSSVTVAYDTKDHTGLSGFYENTKPKATLWKPLPDIQGFPAVAHVTSSAGNSLSYFCQVSVGIADNLSIDVSIILGDAKKGTVDPCQVTAQSADMVVTNLRQKAGA
jgi:hypothetical protein